MEAARKIQAVYRGHRGRAATFNPAKFDFDIDGKRIVEIPVGDRLLFHARILYVTLESLPFFRGRDLKQCLMLCRIATFEQHTAGAWICRAGHRASAVYLVVSGIAGLFDSTEECVHELERGEAYGVDEVMKGSKRSKSLRALSDTELLCFERAGYLRSTKKETDAKAMTQKTDFLLTVDMFSGCGRHELQRLAGCSVQHTFEAGEVIVASGNFPQEIHIIFKGDASYIVEDQIAIDRRDDDSNTTNHNQSLSPIPARKRHYRVRVVELLPGQIIGYHEMLRQVPNIYTAIAGAAGTTVLTITNEDVDRWLDSVSHFKIREKLEEHQAVSERWLSHQQFRAIDAVRKTDADSSQFSLRSRYAASKGTEGDSSDNNNRQERRKKERILPAKALVINKYYSKAALSSPLSMGGVGLPEHLAKRSSSVPASKMYSKLLAESIPQSAMDDIATVVPSKREPDWNLPPLDPFKITVWKKDPKRFPKMNVVVSGVSGGLTMAALNMKQQYSAGKTQCFLPTNFALENIVQRNAPCKLSFPLPRQKTPCNAMALNPRLRPLQPPPSPVYLKEMGPQNDTASEKKFVETAKMFLKKRGQLVSQSRALKLAELTSSVYPPSFTHGIH